MNLKEQSKVILKQHPEIIKAYVFFAIGLIIINLPEFLLKMGIKLIANGVHFKWLKLITYIIDIPVAATTWLMVILLFFAANYYLFLKASGQQTSFRIVLKGFKLNTVLKFIGTMIYWGVTFLFLQIPTLLLGLPYAVYSALKFFVDVHLPIPLLFLYFAIVIFSFLSLTLYFIKRFGLVIYVLLYDSTKTFREILKINKYIYKTGKNEFSALMKSYLPMLLLSVVTCGIYLFYAVPCFQISLILLMKKYYNHTEN